MSVGLSSFEGGGVLARQPAEQLVEIGQAFKADLIAGFGDREAF